MPHNEKYVKSVTVVNQLLCNVFVLYVKLWNFHWNFVGPTFNDRHPLFGEYKDGLSNDIDLLAERVRQLGGVPKSNMAEFLSNSTITEAESKLTCEECTIPTLYTDFCNLSTALQKAGMVIAEDLGTQTLLADLILKYDKITWFLDNLTKTQSNAEV